MQQTQRTQRTRGVMALTMGCAAVALVTACQQDSTQPLPRRTTAEQLTAAAARSPIEGSGVTADVALSVDGVDRSGRWRHVDLPAQHLTGRVVRGTGFVTLGAFDGARQGRQTIPVLETDFGRAHGRLKIMGRTANISGHSLGLALDPGASGAPASAMRVSVDGALVYSAVPEWVRVDGAWELRKLTMNVFQNGQLTRRAVATIQVTHRGARVASTASTTSSVAGVAGAADRLSLTRLFVRVGAVAADALLPPPLAAQAPFDTVKDGSPSIFGWIIKGAATMGGLGAAIGATIEDFALASMGGVIGMFGIGFDIGVFISQQFSSPSSSPSSTGSACADYFDEVAFDSSSYDPVMEDVCG